MANKVKATYISTWHHDFILRKADGHIGFQLMEPVWMDWAKHLTPAHWQETGSRWKLLAQICKWSRLLLSGEHAAERAPYQTMWADSDVVLCEPVLQCYIKIVKIWNVYFIYCRALVLLTSLSISEIDCLSFALLNDSSDCVYTCFECWYIVFLK